MIKFALINEGRLHVVEPKFIRFYLGIFGKTGVHAVDVIIIHIILRGNKCLLMSMKNSANILSLVT